VAGGRPTGPKLHQFQRLIDLAQGANDFGLVGAEEFSARGRRRMFGIGLPHLKDA
jgi:hypothetical protein